MDTREPMTNFLEVYIKEEVTETGGDRSPTLKQELNLDAATVYSSDLHPKQVATASGRKKSKIKNCDGSLKNIFRIKNIPDDRNPIATTLTDPAGEVLDLSTETIDRLALGDEAHLLPLTRTKVAEQQVSGNNTSRKVPPLMQCEPCSTGAPPLHFLLESSDNMTGKRSICETCGNTFTQPSTFGFKHKTRDCERPYACDICGKRFIWKTNLHRHHIMHSEEKTFTCNMCGTNFATKSRLEVHNRIHNGEKPFVCEQCGKSFTTLNYLKNHHTIHRDIVKPYKCEFCDLRFKQMCYLKYHMETHNIDKAYACDMCDKRFPRRNSLVMHKRIHTGDKPFSCEVCNKRFICKSALKVHFRKHSGEKPYSCNICGNRYRHNVNLRHHSKVHEFSQ